MRANSGVSSGLFRGKIESITMPLYKAVDFSHSEERGSFQLFLLNGFSPVEMRKEFQVRLLVLEGDVTMPRNPKIIQILPGETVFGMRYHSIL